MAAAGQEWRTALQRRRLKKLPSVTATTATTAQPDSAQPDPGQTTLSPPGPSQTTPSQPGPSQASDATARPSGVFADDSGGDSDELEAVFLASVSPAAPPAAVTPLAAEWGD